MAPTDINNALRAEEQLATDLNDYAGEWVAIREHNVVCNANSLRGLLDARETQDIDRIDRIFEVSKESGVSCFF